MRKYPFSLPFLAVLFLLSACKTTYQPGAVNYLDYRVSSQQTTDTAMLTLLRPYADSLNKSMNDVIAVAGMNLEKKQPEGTLNNVLADAMMVMSRELNNTQVDAAFVNYGGVRLTALPAGNITRGKIFEVAPFDNVIVLQKINGQVFQQFLNLVAERGGWPCAGISFQIKDKKAINVRIDNKLIEPSAGYTIALLDYVANGGDDCTMLKNIPQLNNGYLFRDAVIKYFSKLNAAGKQVTANIENRVSNAN
jgi:2',3'-cyclic-nucleotide 2'-phosphodiesterase (5'-nucleotidase family)